LNIHNSIHIKCIFLPFQIVVMSITADTKKIIEYQTRSDDRTGIQLFKTFDDAYAAYQEDPTIWIYDRACE
jgi:hypothetical protein